MKFILESSAIAALLNREPHGGPITDALENAGQFVLPVHCILEISLTHRLGPDRLGLLETLGSMSRCQIVGLPAACAELLQHAALRYGKGSGSGARLNFGDCLSYAIARHLDLPLLYAGEDFARTDITPAIDWTTA